MLVALRGLVVRRSPAVPLRGGLVLSSANRSCAPRHTVATRSAALSTRLCASGVSSGESTGYHSSKRALQPSKRTRTRPSIQVGDDSRSSTTLPCRMAPSPSTACTREPTGSATARSLCSATPPLSGAGDMVLPVRTTAWRPRLTASTTPQHSAAAISESGGGDEVPGTCGIFWGVENGGRSFNADLEVWSSAGGAAHDAVHVADRATARLEVGSL